MTSEGQQFRELVEIVEMQASAIANFVPKFPELAKTKEFRAMLLAVIAAELIFSTMPCVLSIKDITDQNARIIEYFLLQTKDLNPDISEFVAIADKMGQFMLKHAFLQEMPPEGNN